MTRRTGLAFLFLTLLTSCHPKSPSAEGAVATLAGKPVTVADLRDTARFMGLGKVSDRSFESWPPALAKTVFEETLYDRLLLEAADKRGVTVTPEEVQDETKRIMGLSAPEGGGPPVLSDDLVRRKLLLLKTAELIAHAPEISRKMALAEYNREKDHFALPERALVRDIVVRSEDEGKAILAALTAGSSFSALAKVKSLSPESAEGGLLPPFSLGEMPALFSVAFSMKPGEVSQLLSSPYGYHILKLVKIIPPRTPPFREVRKKIERTLQERVQKSALTQWFSEKIQAGTLVIVPKYQSTLSLSHP